MNCPFCSERIWGEGWNSKTGERFYSHVSEGEDCAWELGIDIDGSWKKYSGALPVSIKSSETGVDGCGQKETPISIGVEFDGILNIVRARITDS